MNHASGDLAQKLGLALEGQTGQVWDVRPFQLVSLLDMIKLAAFDCYVSLRDLHSFEAQVDLSIGKRGDRSELKEHEKRDARTLLDMLKVVFEHAGLERATERLGGLRLTTIIPDVPIGLTLKDLKWELEELERAIEWELLQRLFLGVPADKALYYDKPELFSTKVKEKFPEANKEVTEAGNCYATGNNTACVFHLMRAVEYGVRVVVKRLRIAKALPHPVALCEWGQIVNGLDNAIKKMPRRTSPKASEKYEFYKHALAQFGNFKDAWRNPVSHARVTYDEHQAMSVIVNTRQFMQHLAERLKE